MWATEQLDFAIRITAIIAPVACYFLILGLLNSRRRPQMLRGRLDFALLIGALSPLFIVAVLHWTGPAVSTALLTGAAVVAGIFLLAPRGETWVIYNIAPEQARRSVRLALDATGIGWQPCANAIVLADGQGRIEVSSFPILRNVAIRLAVSPQVAEKFAAELARTLNNVETQTSAMASALLLVAAAMMVAPLALMAGQAGKIVRILTDLLN